MDYAKKEEEYKEAEAGEKYYLRLEERPEEQKLPAFDDLVRDVPVSGSIVSVPDFHKNAVFFTSLDTHAYSVAADSGEMLWKFKTGGQIVSSPLVHKEKVYFGSFDGHLYCLDADGTLLWKKNTGDIVSSSPTGIADRIFVCNGLGYVLCFSTDGEELWRFRTGDGIIAYPAAANGLVFITSYDKNLYALDIDGSVQWKFTTGERSSAPVIMSKGATLFSGSRRSRDKMPRADGAQLYIGSYDNNLYCLDMGGEVVWKFNCGTSIPGGVGGGNGTVYAGTVSGRVFAVDARTGDKRWDFLAGGVVTGGGEVANGNVYFTSFDQKLYCVSEDGRKLWDFLTGGPVVFRPLIVNDKIYFGSADTFLYCIDAKKRAVDWTFQAGFGLPDAKTLITQLSNTLVEYDRKIFKVWHPETIKPSAQQPFLRNYNAPVEGFEFGGLMSYSTTAAYKSSKNKYVSGSRPYGK